MFTLSLMCFLLSLLVYNMDNDDNFKAYKKNEKPTIG